MAGNTATGLRRLDGPRSGNQDIFFARFSIPVLTTPPNDRFEPDDTPIPPRSSAGSFKNFLPKLVVTPGDEDLLLVEAAATGT